MRSTGCHYDRCCELVHVTDINVTDAGNRLQGRNLLKSLAFLP